MKKVMFIVSFVLAITAVCICVNMKNDNLSDLALANIEALANKVPTSSDSECEDSLNSWCSFVVVTPSGNHIESHCDKKPLP